MSVESQPLARAVTSLGREALRIVLPSWCVSCRQTLPWRARKASCCAECWSAMRRLPEVKCSSCALPGAAVCLQCIIEPLPVGWCDAWGVYAGPLAALVQTFKYDRHDFLDDVLAGLLEEVLRARGDLAFDAIVPVPMHPAKVRRRGYNQAALLGRALASRIGVPVKPLLAKTTDRGTQSSLTRRERAENVRGSYVASDAAGLSLLLIDDICTTGETLRACASQLVAQGAARVCALTVAKAD